MFDMRSESIGTRFARLDTDKVAGQVGKVYGSVVAPQLQDKLLVLKFLRPNTHNAGFMATFGTAHGDMTIGVASTSGFATFRDQEAARAAFESL